MKKEVPVVTVGSADDPPELHDLPAELTIALSEIASSVREGLLAFASGAGLWKDGQMKKRLIALGMLEAERSFRRIKGYKDMSKFVDALRRDVHPAGRHTRRVRSQRGLRDPWPLSNFNKRRTSSSPSFLLLDPRVLVAWASGLSALEASRWDISTQLYRLLYPTNYSKSVRQLISLLYVLGCEVEVEVKERAKPRLAS